MARRSKTADDSDAPPPGRFKRIFWRIFRIGAVFSLIGIIVMAVAVGVAVSSIPEFDDLKVTQNAQTIRIRAADGTILQSIGPNYGQWMALKNVPPVMSNAMVAVEDRRFRYHPGVDPYGLGRSVWVAFEKRGTGRRMQGASTITQQLARNIFLSNSYTFSRKLNEAVLAMAMEWKFSKDEILELYLNKVYFGGGSYGIDAASRRFFGHSATQLSLSEAAIIAGLVKAPSRYSPTADAAAAIERAGVVLAVMQDAGVITPTEAAAASPKAVTLAAQPPQNSARYFTDWALPQLDSLIDETTQPIDIWTTLDIKMQAAATSAIVTSVPAGVQGALVSIDRDGAVRAMVGGTDYVTSNYNRATIATRQPGSAWKIFVYMAAIESGYKLTDIVVDEPVDIGGWQPKNSSGRFSGEMNLRTAFANSVNTIAAKLGRDVGTASIANMARRFGVNTQINTSPSMVLGTSEVRLIDMTRAVAGIARKGAPVTPYAISKVTTAEGKMLYAHKAESMPTVIEPWVAAGITDLMQTAVVTGTGRAAQIGRPVAGKTGTTNSNKDGYFVGFSSGLTTGVWMGRDDNKTVGGLQGGRAPATAFSKYMRIAVAGRPVEKFDTNVTPPDWVLEGTEGQEFGEPGQGPTVDENGMPIEIPDDRGADPADPDPATLDDKWLDEITGGGAANPGINGNDDAPPKQRQNNTQPKSTQPKQNDAKQNEGEVSIQ